MPDETIPATHPNTPATTTGPVPSDRQAPHTQATHPSTSAHDDPPSGIPEDVENIEDGGNKD